MSQIVSHVELPIRNEDDCAIVPRRVKELAQTHGFDVFATAAVSTAASELARNALVHGAGGTVVIEEIDDGERLGLRLQFRDQGPGIADLARALAGGYSTARSLGLGLSGTRRLVDRFEIDTAPGKGTVVTVEKWPRY